MKNDNVAKDQNKILTLPNLLSFFRLCLIPVIVWLYIFKQDYLWTVLILLLSGATDIIDGFIARRFNMVSNVGKAFDPIADKLTQIVVLICLVIHFPYMLIPLIVLVIKEIMAAVLGLLVIKKTSVVMGAVWHGKLTTVMLYCMMLIHLIWNNIPRVASDVLVAVCTAMMLTSAVLYTGQNLKILREVEE